ncbi:MAG: hypothetical protein ACOY3Y_10130 [Acidobacteriota bacterium]
MDQLHYFLGREAVGERLFEELITDERDFAEGWSCLADELRFCAPGTSTPRRRRRDLGEPASAE